MNFEEWLCQHSDMPEIGDYEIVKDAWNQALEEAANVAEEEYENDPWNAQHRWAGDQIANRIRQLKTKE